jgi:hypothetical protein
MMRKRKAGVSGVTKFHNKRLDGRTLQTPTVSLPTLEPSDSSIKDFHERVAKRMHNSLLYLMVADWGPLKEVEIRRRLAEIAAQAVV